MTYIYALLDPGTDDVRYIGKSDNPKARFKYHMAQSRTGTSYRVRWIRTLTAQGLKPDMRILLEVPDNQWEEAEIRTIAEYKALGHRLTNGDSGGRGGRKASDELRQRLSEMRKGRIHSPELIERIAQANRGQKRSDETRQKMSASHQGLQPSQATRLKMSMSQRGRKHTAETKAKCSEVNKGRVFTEEHRRKLSEAAKNRRKITAELA